MTQETVPRRASAPPEVAWRRLDRRVIWLNVTKGLLSLLPTTFTVTVLHVKLDSLVVWSTALAAAGIIATAIKDLIRWVTTRYRVTDERVERYSGVFVRHYRSVPRDRIRNVSTTARLRHRLFRLRVVTISAGQSSASGRAAISLDAVTISAAVKLRRELMTGQAPEPADSTAAAAAPRSVGPVDVPDQQLISRVAWWWVFYNAFSIWAFAVAVMVCWVTYWFLGNFGVDLRHVVRAVAEDAGLGTAGSIAFGTGVMAVIGVIGLTIVFITENWKFRLSRVISDRGPTLSTTQGLLRTKETHRDENRIRGIRISEPLVWRWMRMAETELITTGGASWNLAETHANLVLPRCPVGVARRVATVVLNDDTRPFEAALRRHPGAALRRRILWALTGTGLCLGLLAWLGATGALPERLWVWGTGLLPVAVWLAVIAYRALGHTVAGEYLVTRCGLLNRKTAAVQHRTVLGWSMRQSVLQRRLGLITVKALTAAGAGSYHAPDVDAGKGLALVYSVAPSMLAPFVRRAAEDDSATSRTGR